FRQPIAVLVAGGRGVAKTAPAIERAPDGDGEQLLPGRAGEIREAVPTTLEVGEIEPPGFGEEPAWILCLLSGHATAAASEPTDGDERVVHDAAVAVLEALGQAGAFFPVDLEHWLERLRMWRCRRLVGGPRGTGGQENHGDLREVH